MYIAIVTNDFPNSRGRMPIVTGPVEETAINIANRKLPRILRNTLVGDIIRDSIREAFHESELTAKRRTLKLASEYR